MSKGQWMVAVAAAGFIAFSSGCVSLDKYRQLEMSQRKVEAEKASLEQDLYDARSNNENLRNRLSAYEDKLSTKDKLLTNLESENRRLDEAFGSARRTVEELASRNVPQEPIFIETRLPAELDSALKQFASQYPDQVVYDAQRGIVKWTSDLLFGLGSDEVRDTARSALSDFAGIVQSSAASGFDVLIVGHTDDRPVVRSETKQKHPTNWHLSVHRAISVSDVLQNYGVGSSRIGVMGFGEYRPIEPNASEEGRRQNRRVEIYLVPAGSVGGVVVPQTASGSTTRVSPTASRSQMDANIK